MRLETSGAGTNPLLVVISGPSGVGKDAVITSLKSRGRRFHFTVTATTRAPRSGERDGVEYYFTARDKFEQMTRDNDLLEWALVYGNYYGVPRRQVQEALGRGQDVMIKVDVQGAATIKKLVPEAAFVFIAPSSLAELGRRLRQRNADSANAQELRMETARREMETLPMFDYVVVNREGELDVAVAQIEAIITAEKCRVKQRKIVV